MASKKDIRQIMDRLEAAGLVVTATKGGHYKITHPTKPGIVFMSGTPSDHRAQKNLLSQINRIFGVKIT